MLNTTLDYCLLDEYIICSSSGWASSPKGGVGTAETTEDSPSPPFQTCIL